MLSSLFFLDKSLIRDTRTGQKVQRTPNISSWTWENIQRDMTYNKGTKSSFQSTWNRSQSGSRSRGNTHSVKFSANKGVQSSGDFSIENTTGTSKFQTSNLKDYSRATRTPFKQGCGNMALVLQRPGVVHSSNKKPGRFSAKSSRLNNEPTINMTDPGKHNY